MRYALVLPLAALLLAGRHAALADDLDQSEPQRVAMDAAVAVLGPNKAPTSKACLDLLDEWKTTMSAIRYDMVHHDPDLPNARDVLAMNYADAARRCGADAQRYCAAKPAARNCAALPAAQQAAHLTPGQG